MPKRSPRVLAAWCVALLAALSACEPGFVATSPIAPIRSGTLGTSSSGGLPTGALDPAMAAALGPWRRIPFVVDATFSGPYEAACRSKAELAKAPLMLVDDRGGDTVTLLYATASKAYVCRVEATSAATVEDVTAVDIAPPSLGQDGIDSVMFDRIEVTRGGRREQRTLAVGRVGPVPSDVIAIFTDQTPVNASHGHGWYLFWFPGRDKIQGISAVDRSHLVLSSVLPPQ